MLTTTTSSPSQVTHQFVHQRTVELARFNAYQVLEVVHYHGRGSRTIVAIPGLGSSSLLFEGLLEYLPSDLSLMVIHHRGLGNSSPLKEEDDLNTVADDLIQFLEMRSFELCQKFDLLGVSYGGFLAQLMMLKSPSLFHTLALFCTSSGGKDFKPILEITDEALKLQSSLEREQKVLLSVMYSVSEKTNQDKNLLKKICLFRDEVKVSLATTLWQNQAAKDFLKQSLALEFIKARTLVMSGRHDRVVPFENTEKLAQKIPRSHFEIIEQADHLFFLEKSKEVMGKYQDFLMQ